MLVVGGAQGRGGGGVVVYSTLCEHVDEWRQITTVYILYAVISDSQGCIITIVIKQIGAVLWDLYLSDYFGEGGSNSNVAPKRYTESGIFR